MTRLLTIKDIKKIVRKHGIQTCFEELIVLMRDDFARWDEFTKMPRIATHFPHGVIELMPINDDQLYAYKYVNGHPSNPKQKKLTVAATGMLSEVSSGYPILLSEMTLLTAIRTAAACALASNYLARPESSSVGIIGTGSQAEFQVLALNALFPITKINYFDIDPNAMKKFSDNLSAYAFELRPCENAQATIEEVDIIVTATADKQRLRILENDWIKPGVHINGVGGDCPGKTELDPALLKRAKIVVEYLEQSKIEGEIQNLTTDPYAELWELITEKKKGREYDDEITLFDSVGFALEDFSVLRYFHELAETMNIGEKIDLVPSLSDPKNLFSLLVVD